MLNKIKESPIRSLLYYIATSLLVFSLITGNPISTVKGIGLILQSPSTLITDYIGVAGMSAAFLNSALVSFMTLYLFEKTKIKYNGTSIASFFLMAGFALFGKNILNIIPIFIGVFIYANTNKDTFRKYIYTALFGTSIAPVVSEIAVNFSGTGITLQSVVIGTLVGVGSGFLLPALSVECLRILQGFNLYNTGFAAGLIGILFTSAIKSFGFDSSIRMIWTTGQNVILCVYLYLLFASLIIYGFILNEKSFKGYTKIFRHSGRAVADFTVMDGVPLACVNMGVVGIFALSYLIVLNGDVNGPTVGAIFTIVGFGALGKHLKNMWPPMLGVFIMSIISNWSLTDPSVQLAALFCTGLAPIAGQFGIGWGIVAGAMHSVIVLSVTSFHGGLNLYNNGFAAGLVVIILLPTIQSLAKDD
ncbi:MAG: DUF1576 domain-containing protein [Clostridia bacterium]